MAYTTGQRTATAKPTPKETDTAQSIIRNFLAEFGLEGLGKWALDRYIEVGGGSLGLQVIESEMVDRPEFLTRFPAYKDLAKKGRAMSPAEMLAYERTATQILRSAGLPAGFYDQPSDFAAFLRNEVSVGELQQRVDVARDAVDAEPAERDWLLARGLTVGELVAQTLDPDRGLPIVQRSWRAAQAGGAASLVGIDLETDVADRLARENLGREDLRGGFGQVAELEGLYNRTAGEQNDPGFTQAEQVGSVFGTDPASRRRLEKKAKSRQAEFSGSSGFRAGQGGVVGLGGS